MKSLNIGARLAVPEEIDFYLSQLLVNFQGAC